MLPRSLPMESYIPKVEPIFIDSFDLLPLFEKLAFRANLILSGPKGIGKSLSFAAYAAREKLPIVTVDCSEDMRRSNLLGMFIMEGSETPFILGPLSTAFEIANDHGACVLCLEEINALTPQLQKVLNPATDFRKRVEIPEAQCVFQLEPEARLWIVGTMNTAVYGGVYALNEDLKSRFRILPLSYPERKEEKEIIKGVLKDFKDFNLETVEHVLTLAAETRTASIEYALSTRDVIQLLEDIHTVKPYTALSILRGKFEEQDRNTIDQRIRSIFGVEFKTPKKK